MCGVLLSSRFREDTVMAKNGFRLIDAEMHVMEPADLWTARLDVALEPVRDVAALS